MYDYVGQASRALHHPGGDRRLLDCRAVAGGVAHAVAARIRRWCWRAARTIPDPALAQLISRVRGAKPARDSQSEVCREPLSGHRRRRVHRLLAGARAAGARRQGPHHRQLLVGQARELRRLRRRDRAHRSRHPGRQALARAVDGTELIFHEAAIPSVPKSMAEPIENHAANATGTLRVLSRRAAPRCAAWSTRRRPRPTATRPCCPSSRPWRRRRSRPTAGRSWPASSTADLRARLRAGDGLPALLQRVRPAPGSAVRVRGRDPQVHHRGAGRSSRASSATARSRATSATSTTSSRPTSRRRRRRPAGLGRRVQHRLRPGHRPQPGRGAHRRHPGRRSSRSTKPSAPATSSTRRPTSRQARARLGYTAAVSFAEGLRRTLAWYKARLV